MIKLSACIEMLFSDAGDFYSRFTAAKQAGLNAVEFWGWTGKDLGRVKEELAKNELTLAACCISGDKNPLVDEFNKKRLLYRDSAEPFKAAVSETIAVAKDIGTDTLIVTVGQERNDATRYEQHSNIVRALKAAAPILEDAGMMLVVEPLNVLCDHRGYFLASSYEAFEIMEEVDSSAVKVLYDIYHQQISEGNLIPTIKKYIDLIGHFHLADVPGRHEPGTGEINYPNVFKAIDSLGYSKHVGMEYSSIAASAESVKAVIGMTK